MARLGFRRDSTTRVRWYAGCTSLEGLWSQLGESDEGRISKPPPRGRTVRPRNRGISSRHTCHGTRGNDRTGESWARASVWVLERRAYRAVGRPALARNTARGPPRPQVRFLGFSDGPADGRRTEALRGAEGRNP